MTTKENSIVNSKLLNEFTLEYLKKHEELINFVKKETEKQLALCNVSQQRELLLDFISKVNGNLMAHPHLQMNTDFIDEYIKSNNCG